MKKVETSVVNFSINVEMPKQIQTIENIESIADNMETSQDCLDDNYLMEQLSLRNPDFGSSVDVKDQFTKDIEYLLFKSDERDKDKMELTF